MSFISFQRVTKRYPEGHDGLREVSFEVTAGEMLFVTGHSGAGKTTLLKLLNLLEMPTRGQIRIGNVVTGKLRRGQVPALRRRMGNVFQNHRLLPERNVFENVALPLVIAGLPRTDIARRTRAALDTVGLRDFESSMPAALSGGEQQRVGIARAVVARPPLLLADEPTGNLDPALSLEIMSLLRRFGQVGTTVLIASHDLHLIKQMRRRTLVLEGGRLVDDFRPSESS